MSSAFPTDFKELVRSRTSLVELVGDTISLTPLRGGTDYVGLCPFHDDHNPSFHVYPDRQSYRCWVCQEGGDCFSFVMKTAGVGFSEALELLANRARIELPKTQRRTSRDGGSKNQSLEALAWAENEFHHCLLKAPEAAPARDYLRGRGFTDETIARFRLGFHPDDWQWLLDRARGKFRPEQLIAARLVAERKSGAGYYDYFRNRILFPIRNERAQVVAFGGRILPGDPSPDAAKYWNSPESELFSKSRLLYGFDVAREAIRRSGTVVVVEGYTDAIMAQQHGLANVVGTLGTALTESHVMALKRFARKVVLLYDGDDAGRMAAERSLAKFLACEVDLRVLTLPDRLDPDEFLAARGADALRQLIDSAEEAWEYKLRQTIDTHGMATIDARHRVLEEMLGLMAQTPRLSQSIRKDIVLGKLAQRLRLDEKIVRRRLGEMTASRRTDSRATGGATAVRRVDSTFGSSGPRGPAGSAAEAVFFSGPGGRPDKDDLLECELLQILFLAPDHVFALRQEIAVDDVRNLHLQRLLQFCYDLAEQGIAPSYDRVIAALEDPDQKRLVVKLDELARDMQIAAKLNEPRPLRVIGESEQDGSPKGIVASDSVASDGVRAGGLSEGRPSRPWFLSQVVRHLVWRRREQDHERSKGQVAQVVGLSSGLDTDDKELLRLMTRFHQERATKKTTL